MPGVVTRASPDPDRDRQVRQQFAAALREARQREGLTQQELERRLAATLGVEGIAPATISRYERADKTPPWGTLDALCEVLSGRPGALADALIAAMRR